eukprot:CAMPEP_0201589394 /NCGR_PEP_ID=MMETSP0190_2-20130828/166035_1 /ASSEMBLY_ACC=CAM_ASM_000263 /TAXON_ID=37353 /ORGANISM="Rosalina sp." /LENGTH=79 /DNA_ID=CAMNT_0048043449 /DNA_START=80 /DNA_END=316 /DNA_ORIENTATION=-
MVREKDVPTQMYGHRDEDYPHLDLHNSKPKHDRNGSKMDKLRVSITEKSDVANKFANRWKKRKTKSDNDGETDDDNDNN